MKQSAKVTKIQNHLNMKKLFKNIVYCLIVIIVTPAAIIHIAYRHWYFKNFVIKSVPRDSVKDNNE